jgi:GNAT superfamily N-acetyltransferase
MNVKPAPFRISLSPLDFERFGVITAKAGGVTSASLSDVNAFCLKNNVQLCVARCAATDFEAVHALEREKFELMDTVVYYRRELVPGDVDVQLPADARIREALPDDAEKIQALAQRSFANYGGHYHQDSRLPTAKADAVYADWAYQSVLKTNSTNVVLIAETAGRMSGFGVLTLNTPEELEGNLFAVDPSAQGKGLYKSLMLSSLNWGRAKAARHMIISTQIINLRSQSVWSKLAFSVSDSIYTFHRWSEPTSTR